MTLKLHTQASFSREIERLVKEKKLTYYEAVCEFIRETGIEPESVPKLINQSIKDHIEEEATELHLINRGKKKPQLPI